MREQHCKHAANSKEDAATTVLQQHKDMTTQNDKNNKQQILMPPTLLTKSVLDETSQLERSWSNDVASLNMLRCEQSDEVVVPY